MYTIASNRLTSYKDQEGRVTTYGYTNRSASARLFDNISGDSGASIAYTHLTSVKYPTNAQTIYTYTRLSRTLNTAYGRYQQFYGVNSRKEIPDASQSAVVKDSQSFAYTVSGKYLTRATATKSDSVVSTHTFNTDGLQTAETVAHGGKTVSGTAYTYNTYKLPSKQVITTYNQSSQSIQRAYSWTYDIKGNVLTETDLLSNVTTNTYHSTYYLPLTKVYKKDSATTITEENTLGLSNRVVQWIKVYETVGGVKTIRQATQYLYDGNYNVSEERRYYGSLTALNTCHSTLITYLNNNPALSSSYNGVYPTVTQATGVLDADGALAYGDGVVRTETMFDWCGRAIAQTDPLGNTTTNAYDKLGRAVQITHPDGICTANVYKDSANTITTTDENGNQMLYQYTPLGQIRQVTDLTTGKVLREFAYDHLNRPITETVYSPEGIRNTTQFTYDRYSRVLTTQKKDAGGTVLYEENDAYNDAYNSTTTKETKTVVGDENAPSIVTTVCKDKLGREVQRGYFPDGVTERVDVFTYDNLGNKLTAKTALDAQRGLAYTGKWEYDFAGRVFKEYNALGQIVQSEYDALGNKVSFTDIKGGKAAVPYSTTYTYDALGRVLTQTTPFEEKNGVIYRKVA